MTPDTIETIAQGDAQERAYLAALSYAKDLGERHGRNAASWIDIPDAATARAILAGLEDGDPAILDTLPSPDLSGEWAGTLTGPELVWDAWDHGAWQARLDAKDHIHGLPYDDWHAQHVAWYEAQDLETLGFSTICHAYEDAFRDAAEDEVSRRARYMAE